MDHLQGVERPYVHTSEAEKERQAKEKADLRREREFKSHVHDLQGRLGIEKAEALASVITGYKPKKHS